MGEASPAPQDSDSAASEADLVVAFCRSPTHLDRDQRVLWQRSLPPADHAECLRRTSLNLRDDVARIFVAARLAAAHRAPLLLVEGWRCHVVERPGGGVSRVTGSWLGCLLLKMLQSRRLVDPRVRVRRRDCSRCTSEEVACALEVASGEGASRIVGVAGRACPSSRRAARYFRLQGHPAARVHDCWQVLDGWTSRLTPEERSFVAALGKTPLERVGETAFEGANWLLHWASRAEWRLLRPRTPLEVRLARRLRVDQPQGLRRGSRRSSSRPAPAP